MTRPIDIDARGMLCPLPVLRLRKALLSLPVGGQVRMIVTDTMALVDVPHFCSDAGHALISVTEIADRQHEFVVARGLSAPLAASGLPPEDI
ncbi:sulfurtransferase TusA family protein [Paracoccus sp. 11-3]|uniref:Sulfurtransferase TusA family protein n=1 Tax=Paracoccus amoyensis TaxID=2760093 RepID=A0A926J5D7_9RHOB|nr:sulfurtransferase TusA family protein [Paracoccus amoyensis]MBC9246112.1 sulfurtransferase TusA family protein [Paracoccus amoyensis]